MALFPRLSPFLGHFTSRPDMEDLYARHCC